MFQSGNMMCRSCNSKQKQKKKIGVRNCEKRKKYMVRESENLEKESNEASDDGVMLKAKPDLSHKPRSPLLHYS